jgi:hypothetical protein
MAMLDGDSRIKIMAPITEDLVQDSDLASDVLRCDSSSNYISDIITITI